MKFKSAKGLIRNILERIKEDTLEVYHKIPRAKEQRTEKRRLNIWVGAFIIAACILAFYLYMPLLSGMFGIIYEAASPEATPSPSHEALLSFIIISTALGTLILWFARATSSNAEKEPRRYNPTKGLGKFFLVAALSLTVFMLLSPLIPIVRDSSDFYSNAIKALAMLSFLGGCTAFIVAIILGFFYLWKM